MFLFLFLFLSLSIPLPIPFIKEKNNLFEEMYWIDEEWDYPNDLIERIEVLQKLKDLYKAHNQVFDRTVLPNQFWRHILKYK